MPFPYRSVAISVDGDSAAPFRSQRHHVIRYSRGALTFAGRAGGHLTTNVPMLELDGKFYTQSSAVLRLVGRRGKPWAARSFSRYAMDNP